MLLTFSLKHYSTLSQYDKSSVCKKLRTNDVNAPVCKTTFTVVSGPISKIDFHTWIINFFTFVCIAFLIHQDTFARCQTKKLRIYNGVLANIQLTIRNNISGFRISSSAFNLQTFAFNFSSSLYLNVQRIFHWLQNIPQALFLCISIRDIS